MAERRAPPLSTRWRVAISIIMPSHEDNIATHTASAPGIARRITYRWPRQNQSMSAAGGDACAPIALAAALSYLRDARYRPMRQHHARNRGMRRMLCGVIARALR